MSHSPQTAVVADIGGTNTRVAIAKGHDIVETSIKRYKNASQTGLTQILTDYLGQNDVNPDAACVAMAGPVRDGVGRLTNLDWAIDRDVIARATGAGRVAVLNDLQAQGHALASLSGNDLVPILPRESIQTDAPKLVVGVGTGLNAAPIYSVGNSTVIPASESGHVSLPVRSEEELRLRDFIARKHPEPGIEDVLSGRGFERIYAWISHEAGQNEERSAADIMASVHSDALAMRTVQTFSRILGGYVGDLALITLPLGGIYLCGGVAQHFAPHLTMDTFGKAFAAKGRFTDFMAQFPVHLVANDYAALTGCACHLEELRH